MRMFNNKVLFDVAYFNKVTTDIGCCDFRCLGTTIPENVASLRNNGLETLIEVTA